MQEFLYFMMKVADSGAFPMGVLHALTHILHKLDPHNERWKAEQIKAAQRISDPKIRQETIQRIEESFTLNELDYGRKLYLIQNCIYGVDIQPIAIQIAKLRFFISLLVDERIDRTKPNLGIEPLPNLETKFVAANTLIALPKPEQLDLIPEDVRRLEEQLKETRAEYFIATITKEKERLRKRDAQLRAVLSDALSKSGFPLEATEKIAQWNPYDTNKSADWFEPEWMFGVNEGFDIVIGNPPHGADISEYLNKIVSNYDNYDSRKNSASFFVNLTHNLLKQNGITAYIIPKSLTYVEGWKRTRDFVLCQNRLLVMLDISKSFENVLLEQIVVVYKNIISHDNYTIKTGSSWGESISMVEKSEQK